jgi:hypothetical protein
MPTGRRRGTRRQNMEQLNVRIPGELLRRLDAVADSVLAKHPLSWTLTGGGTRSDLIRLVLAEWLDEWEQKHEGSTTPDEAEESS